MPKPENSRRAPKSTKGVKVQGLALRAVPYADGQEEGYRQYQGSRVFRAFKAHDCDVLSVPALSGETDRVVSETPPSNIPRTTGQQTYPLRRIGFLVSSNRRR